jgi:hypothetical protein
VRVDWIERLSEQLSLIPFSQDWGICNADASRLNEFLEFYQGHAPEDPYELEALAELILQSAEDALSEGDLEAGPRSGLIEFVREHHAEFPDAFAYWSGLESEEWRVSSLIREVFGSPTRRPF